MYLYCPKIIFECLKYSSYLSGLKYAICRGIAKVANKNIKALLWGGVLYRQTAEGFAILMRSLVYLPVELLKKADNEGWLRSCAYFVRLKSLYKNNTHYNFSLRSLSSKVKCSTGCLSFHLKVLHQKGLIVYHGRNVTFLGVRKILDLMGKKQMRNIAVPVDPINQYDILRCQIIRFNLSAQEYNIRKSGRQIQNFGDVPHTRREKTESCYVGLSALGVGNLFGLSGASGSRIRKKLANLHLLKLRRMFSVLYENVSLKHFNSMKWTGAIPVYSRYVEGRILVEKRYSIKYTGGES